MNATLPSLSVLAVGLCGNARLHEKLGSSEASRAVDRCLKRIERAVDASGGRIERSDNDELIAVFSSAEAVVHAAIEMQLRVATLPPVSGVKIVVRVGISHAQNLPEEALTREATRLAGLAKSGQILACGRIGKALPDALRAQLIDSGLVLASESGEEHVLEVMLEAPPRADLAKDTSHEIHGEMHEATPVNAWLRLRYGGNTQVFEEYHSIVDMGRDSTCDIIIRDVRASRRHATIKYNNSLVVLVDSSRNGTYVSLSGEAEQLIKDSECILNGKGTIAFASSSSAPDVDCVEFECL